MAGQLYIVNVICHADLSNPSASTVVPSDDALVRLGINYDIILNVPVFRDTVDGFNSVTFGNTHTCERSTIKINEREKISGFFN